MFAQKSQEIRARNKVCLGGFEHVGGEFVRLAGDRGGQAEDFPRVRNSDDEGFAVDRRGGKLYAPGAEDKDAARRLPFDKESSPFWVAGGGGNRDKQLHSGRRKIAKEQVLAMRARHAALDDFETVGSAHGSLGRQSTPLSARENFE